MLRSLPAAIVAALGAGCGYGPLADTPGGADNLPTSGAGPYTKPEINFDTPADEPYVLADRRAQLTDPSALARADGGFRIWYTRLEDDAPGAEIYAAELPAITQLPDLGPAVALSASEPWEQDDVRDPAVVELPDGRLVMFYQGGVDAPGIGRAESTDGGATWEKHPGNPVVSPATSPGAAFLDDHFTLAFTMPGEPGIVVADGGEDGDDFADSRLAVAASETKDAFDELLVGQPSLVAEHSESGRSVYGMFYVGERAGGSEPSGTVSAIGFAGSFDGQVWELPASGEPILDGAVPGERGPSAVIGATSATLFYSELRQNRGRIGVAVHP